MVKEIKEKKDLFENTFLPMGGDVDVESIKYKTLEEVPVCVVDGGKEPTDWFTSEADLHHIMLFAPSAETIQERAEAFHALSKEAQANPLVVNHLKPKEDRDRLEREQEELKSGKRKTKSALSRLRDAKTNDDVIRIQAGNKGYQLVKKNDMGALGFQKEDQTYELCRNADHNRDGSIRLWAYKKGGHKVFDLQKCQANASAFFAPVEALKNKVDILKVITAGSLQTPDYCVADSLWIASSENGVYRFDKAIKGHILASKEISNAKDIVDKIEKAQVGTREAMAAKKRAEEHQRVALRNTWIGVGTSTLASIIAMLYVSGKIKLGKSILKKIRNISDEAKSGTLGKPEHWMGMNGDLKQMAEIMGAPQINSVRTIGPNGSGKSARWEALAVCIEAGRFPDGTPIPNHLKGKKVYELTPKIHIMGDEQSSYLGAAEQFVRKVADAVSKRGDILHVDEAHGLHNLGSTTASSGSGGAEEGLKPMMARKGKGGKKARLGFSSTEEEYARSLGTNKALHGRTIPVYVSEPTPQQTLEIMQYKKDLYEKDAGRKISAGALEAAVRLTESDTDTHYPRKAEKLLEQAYSKAAPGAEVTAEHVQTAANDLVNKALQTSVDHAVAERNDAETRLSPEEQAKVMQKSIADVIREWVDGFDGTLDATQTNKLARLIDIVAMSWKKATTEAPMIRSVHKPSSDPHEARYGVPESFTQATLKNCASKEGIILKPTVVSTSRKSGGGGTGAPPDEPPAGASGKGRIENAGQPEPDRGGARRTIVELEPERASVLEKFGGFAPLAGILGITTALKHFDIFNSNQAEAVDTSLFTAMAVADAGIAVTLAGGIPGGGVGAWAGAKAAKAAGFDEQSLTYKEAVVEGGLIGGVASLKIAEQFQTFRNFHTTIEAGTKAIANTVGARIGSAGMAIEEGLSEAYQNMRMGVQMYAGEAEDFAKSAAAAGASLVTAVKGASAAEYGAAALSALDAAGAMVTPLIIVGDLKVTGKSEEM